MITLYGLPSCDTCRKARKALEGAGHAVTFHDVREVPLSPAQIRRFLDHFGTALLNTRSTTWRGLSEAERTGDPLTLLGSHPALMKRPVIEGQGGLTLGWTAETRAAWGL